MYASARPTATIVVNKRAVRLLSQAIRSLDSPAPASIKSWLSRSAGQRPGISPRRHCIHSTPARFAEKEYFPAPTQTENIRYTPPAWHHPVYTEGQMNDIVVAHRETRKWSDWVALGMVRLLRFGMDTATGYSHPTEEAKKRAWPLGLTKVRSWFGPSPMTERKWLMRFLFLESVAGVPGMVAASVRHLHSLRRLKRDNGW